MKNQPKFSYSKVLRQTLEALPQANLIELMLDFAAEDEDFRDTLMRIVNIPAQVGPPPLQPDNPALVSQLKKQITRFFERIDENLDPYYETGPMNEVNDFLLDIQTLSPGDQLNVIPDLIETANSVLDDYGIDTAQLNEALKLYGQAAAALELNHADKIAHFDLLFDWLDALDIWDYGTDTIALKEGLVALAVTPDDYRYLIQRINRRLKQAELEPRPELLDWLASFYLKISDEANYLKVREDNLENEAQYYELADYWKNKGESEKYLTTLEGWLTFLNKHRAAGEVRSQYNGFSDYKRNYSSVLGEQIKDGIILEKLVEYYQSQNDEENLLRVLLAQAQYREATFELYKTIKTLAQHLGRWEEVLQRYMGYARRDDEVLARIYLYEQEWAAALELAWQKGRYGYTVIDLVAQGVKQHNPAEAIKLYQKLVKENIDEGNRKHYHFAAEYAAKIKEIYLNILKDQTTWKIYVDQIRAENKRRRALQDEFAGL